MKSDMLDVRKKLKAKKPTFLRQDAHKVKTLKKKWRYPKGIHSKMREKIKGHRRQPNPGWSSPSDVRGLTPEGYKLIIINNVQELLSTNDPKTISSTVGTKKKLEIIKKAKERGIKIMNVPNLDEFIKKTEEKLMIRKEAAKKKEAVVKEKKPEIKEEAKKETLEEREKREKEEKKKVLEMK